MSALDEALKLLLILGRGFKDTIDLAEQASTELAELRIENKTHKDYIDTLQAQREKLLSARMESNMTEAEYKDYLSEQDRIKRQEEEQR